MTTLSPRGVHIGPEGIPEFTLGWQILGWTAEYLLQPDGPNAGEPWRFTDEQARFLLNWFAIDEEGRFIYRRGMLRRMKGWGKDPVGAALCCIEFVGPCRLDGFRGSVPVAAPVYTSWIQTAAVSKEQTRNTMTLFPGMLSKKAQSEYGIDIGKEIIYAQNGRCRIEAVTSSPRALEGGRPTFVLKNETHHWLQSNEGLEMSAVIARNAAKVGARVLAISNAHDPSENSDAALDYEAYLKMAGGTTRGTGFLYDSLEAPPDVELAPENIHADPEVNAQRARESLHMGLQAARGDSIWLDIDRLIEEIYDPQTSPSMTRRFYLNQIIAGEDAWIAPHEWDACGATDKIVLPKELVTLGLDGSKSNDHTVLMACRVEDSHIFPVGVFDPSVFQDNLIPTADVDAAVARAFEAWDIVGFYADVNEWESYTDKWEQDFGAQLCARSSDRHPIKWDMRRVKETTLLVEAYHDAILERDLTHSGDKRIDQYHYNARRRPTTHGVSFAKESPFSSRKIDGAAAGALARKARQDYLALPESKKRQKVAEVGIFWA